ncbi:cyclic pyranopterin monophosphate synthase MoaC [Qipengyuania sp. XHP0207]|uniref:cyclic pyranopterin monophosphate synthase MoaC n=1 Tax=Qipengyuania sp. XHP0207 TaxID=3038078 RepID=UPI00241C2342|nr:cyclic pyranopterin monophosphate synthase MoaC [Qipengyuania sp. XHP0207]MDG5746811.1 cyclic pyranopterin monophosphate synthase MoaC [Qipengyuania sp. XHP0207]
MTGLTHIDDDGRARMVDISGKPASHRTAVARGLLRCAVSTLEAVERGETPKGAVISTAELAGIMAAKRTADLIPMCHPLPLAKVGVRIAIDRACPGFRIEAEVKTTGQTGVEMEALTAVTVAGLTLYDMLKAIDRTMTLDTVQVVRKTGGTGGDWTSDGGPRDAR